MILLAILVIGMFAGWLAQLILGRSTRQIDWQLALGAGFAGSFVGGLLLSVLFGDGLSIAPSGLIGSTLGAVVVTAIYQWWRSKDGNRR